VSAKTRFKSSGAAPAAGIGSAAGAAVALVSFATGASSAMTVATGPGAASITPNVTRTAIASPDERKHDPQRPIDLLPDG
jgi:hypothetical protein